MGDALEWFQGNSWLYVGSFSGSLVAMLMARGLTFTGRLSALTVGAVTGFFVGPFICELWFSSYDPQTSRVPSFVCFASGGFAVALIPIAIKRAKEWAGRYQIKLVAVEKSDE